MKVISCLFILTLILLNPAPAAAAESMMNLTVCRSDGVTTGEFRINDRLVWRIKILGDGAKMASVGSGDGNTTVIVPDIINGQFLLKIKGE